MTCRKVRRSRCATTWCAIDVADVAAEEIRSPARAAIYFECSESDAYLVDDPHICERSQADIMQRFVPAAGQAARGEPAAGEGREEARRGRCHDQATCNGVRSYFSCMSDAVMPPPVACSGLLVGGV